MHWREDVPYIAWQTIEANRSWKCGGKGVGVDCIWRFKVEEEAVKVNPICDVISSSSSCIIYSCANALDYLKLHNLHVKEALRRCTVFIISFCLGLNVVLPRRTLYGCLEFTLGIFIDISMFSVGCPCQYCASARCASSDCLVCRDADIFRDQIVTRIQILYQCSLLSFIKLPYNERNYVHYTLITYVYEVFLFFTVICYLTELYFTVLASCFIFYMSRRMHDCVCVAYLFCCWSCT